MKRPATSSGRRAAKTTSRAAAPTRPDGRPRRTAAAPEIKVTRNSKRPQIKASRGPGGPAKTREVAASGRHQTRPRGVGARGAGARSAAETDRRVAETRRQSLQSMGAPAASHRPRTQGSGKRAGTRSGAARSAPRPASGGGGGAVRAVAAGAGGTAAAAARVVVEAPLTAARPVLRVVTGGFEQATSRANPVARGRMLIMLVGVLAAGLIYINVGKLQYGDGYAKYVARSNQLQAQNTALRAQIADRSSAERIQNEAQKLGLVVPVPEQYTYLKDRSSDAVRASRTYTAPASSAVPAAVDPTASTGASVTTGAVDAGSTATAGATGSGL